MSQYTCPNGHPFPAVQEMKCGGCDASVTVEPSARGMELHREVKGLRELLREVAASGVAFEDERVGYVEVQIDRGTWAEIRAMEWTT